MAKGRNVIEGGRGDSIVENRGGFASSLQVTNCVRIEK